MTVLSRPRAHLAVAAVILLVDQASKAWAVDALAEGRTIEVLWTLRLRLVGNTGASFSMGDGAGHWIGLVAIGIAAALVAYGPRLRGASAQLAVGMILGGAVGNVLDRLQRPGSGFLGGAVVDFIDLQWWPVFNVADMGVVLGGILLVWATREHDEDEDEAGPGAVDAVGEPDDR